jgi:hypothetical protein
MAPMAGIEAGPTPPWPPGPVPAWMAELKPKKWRSRYSEHLMPGT